MQKDNKKLKREKMKKQLLEQDMNKVGEQLFPDEGEN